MKRLWILAAALSIAAGAPALAAGPVDGEIGAIYWVSEYDGSGVAAMTSDAGSPALRASLWLFDKYGVKAGMYRNDLDDFSSVETSDYASFDFLYRPLSVTSNNFLAVGLGWQQMDLNEVGMEGDTGGARLSVEGRVGLGRLFFAYAEGSYQPSLSGAPATNPQYGRFEDLSGQEYELGVSWKPAPFVNLRAGYRAQSVDFNQTGLDPLLGYGTEMKGTAESTGYLMGLTFNF